MDNGKVMELNVPKSYLIDSDKIKPLEDVKIVLKRMKLHFHPQDGEDYEDIKHLLTNKENVDGDS